LEILVSVEGGKPENPEKNFPRSKARTNNKLNPHMAPGQNPRPGSPCWEASALATAPPLLLLEPNTRMSEKHVNEN